MLYLAAALQVEPGNREALRHRGFIEQEKGGFAAAQADYAGVVAQDAKDQDALRGLGFAELSLKRYDAAIADLSAAITLDPKDVAAYRFRSIAYAAKNQAKLAMADLDTLDRLGAGSGAQAQTCTATRLGKTVPCSVASP